MGESNIPHHRRGINEKNEWFQIGTIFWLREASGSGCLSL